MMREPAQDAMPWDRARAPLGRCPFFVFDCPRMDEYAGSATGAFTATRVQATTTYRAGSAIGMALMSHWGRCVKTPGTGARRWSGAAGHRTAPVKRRVGGIIAPHAGRDRRHHGTSTRSGRLGQPARPRARPGCRWPPGPQSPRPHLRRRVRRAVGRLALAALQPRQRPGDVRADPGALQRGTRGPGRAGQVPGGHHALLHQPRRPGRPG